MPGYDPEPLTPFLSFLFQHFYRPTTAEFSLLLSWFSFLLQSNSEKRKNTKINTLHLKTMISMFYWSLKLSSFANLYVVYKHLYMCAYMYRTDCAQCMCCPKADNWIFFECSFLYSSVLVISIELRVHLYNQPEKSPCSGSSLTLSSKQHNY